MRVGGGVRYGARSGSAEERVKTGPEFLGWPEHLEITVLK